jgi:hypothetical protein
MLHSLPYPTLRNTTLHYTTLHSVLHFYTLLLLTIRCSYLCIPYYTIPSFFSSLFFPHTLFFHSSSILFPSLFPFLLSSSYSSHLILHIPSLTLYLFPITPRTSSVCLSPRSPCQHTSRTIVLPLDCKRERLKSKKESERETESCIERERGRERERESSGRSGDSAGSSPFPAALDPYHRPYPLPYLQTSIYPCPSIYNNNYGSQSNQITSNQSQL